MKKVLSFMVALVAILTLVACQNERSNDTLIVGLEADYAPFNWLETTRTDYNYPLSGTNNFVAGYDVDIAIALAEALDMPLEIKAITWSSLIPALESNEIDIIIAGMSPTADRLEVINFTNSYYEANHVAVVKTDSAYANVTALSGLNGARGIGQIGTIYADIIEGLGETHGVTVLPVADTVPLIAQQIIGGNADFTVVEAPVAQGLVAAYPSLKMLFNDVHNIFGVSDDDRIVSIGYRKADTDLGTQLNAALATIDQATRSAWMAAAVTRSAA